MDENPFNYGNKLTNPKQFIGRRAELGEIFARLNGNSVQGTAVVGPRRIGKSSLLYYLTNPRYNEPLRPNPDLHLVYFDAQRGECANPTQFRLSLLKEILARIKPGYEKDKSLQQQRDRLIGRTDFSWGKARLMLETLPYHPIICLDEVEALITPTFENRFFNALRNWQQDGLLTWITASAQPLQGLAEANDLTSPFFNILATLPLGHLSPTEAEELLRQATALHPFTPRERAYLYNLVGGHPFHLQIVGSKWWALKYSPDKRPLPGMTRAHKKGIKTYLCNQPYPPVWCDEGNKSFPWHSMAWVLVGLLFIALVVVLWWFIPAVQGWMQTGRRYGGQVVGWLGTLGDGFGGLFIVVTIVVALFGGLWKGKKLKEIGRELWQWFVRQLG